MYREKDPHTCYVKRGSNCYRAVRIADDDLLFEWRHRFGARHEFRKQARGNKAGVRHGAIVRIVSLRRSSASTSSALADLIGCAPPRRSEKRREVTELCRFSVRKNYCTNPLCTSLSRMDTSTRSSALSCAIFGFPKPITWMVAFTASMLG